MAQRQGSNPALARAAGPAPGAGTAAAAAAAQQRQRSPSPDLPRVHDLVRKQDFKGLMQHLDRVGFADINLMDHKGRTALHLAALLPSIEIVWILLRRGAYVHAMTERNQLTPLHCACIRGNVNVAKMLLKYGADPTITNADNITPLQLLPKDRDLQKFAKWVLNPPPENVKLGKKDKELFARVAVKDEKGMLDMIEKGAEINIVEEKTLMTPLMMAARNGDEDIVRTLLFHCADVHRQDIAKNTALHWAAARGNKTICELLIDFDSSINITDRENGFTPLHWAVSKNHVDLIQFFCVKHKANPNLPDKDGMTPLHIASRKLGLSQCVETLLRVPNIDVDMPDAYGVRPIHFAVRKNDLKLVEALLNIGKADPTVASVTGKTPLHDACEEPNELVVHVLLNSTNGRIDLNAKTDDGFTPLHVAIDRLDKKRSPKHARSVLETVKLLCKKGADPNVRDKGLRTPLMMIDLTSTLTEGTLENSVARLLVSLNADISILHRVVFNRDLPQDLRDKIKDVVEYLQRKKLTDQRDNVFANAPTPAGWRQVSENGETFFVDENNVRSLPPMAFMVPTDPRVQQLASVGAAAAAARATAQQQQLDDDDEQSQTMGITLAEVSCPLCLELLFRPCTTECGHSFCQPCMEESMRFHSHCPVCRQQIRAQTGSTVNAVMTNLVQRAFPERYVLRQREFERLSQAGAPAATRR